MVCNGARDNFNKIVLTIAMNRCREALGPGRIRDFYGRVISGRGVESSDHSDTLPH